MTSTSSKRIALITGASSGIGAAFAGVYAEQGFDLVLTARRQDRMESLAETLGQRHGTRVLVVPADLADPAAPRQLCDRLAAARVDVDVLVNNAGYAVAGRYRKTAWSEHRDFLQVMVTAYAELAYLVLPGMIDRRWGRIVNVASVAGLVPGTPGHTLYGPSKAFLVKFSQALGMEVERDGVHVTAVCPGYTHTEFHDVARVRDVVSRLPRFLWMDAETVARQGYHAAEAGRFVYVNGGVNRAIVGLTRLLPDGLVYAAVRRFAGRLRKQ